MLPIRNEEKVVEKTPELLDNELKLKESGLNDFVQK